MAAPTLWAPGILHAHEIPHFRWVFFGFFWGSANFIFMGAGIFWTEKKKKTGKEGEGNEAFATKIAVALVKNWLVTCLRTTASNTPHALYRAADCTTVHLGKN